MAYEMKEGDISVFPNDKEGNENRPDLTGKVLLKGEEMRVALWGKESSTTGNKFYSGKIEEKFNGSGKDIRSSASEVPF